MDIVVLLLAATATALATGLGAIPVFFLGPHARALQPLLLGVAIGVMTVASVIGLLVPAAKDGSPGEVAFGVLLGLTFLLVARRMLDHRYEEAVGQGPTSARDRGARTAALVVLVLFVHSIPEGLAVGTAYASDTAGLALFVIVAIALHNIPEGTSVAIPMAAAGMSKTRQFWTAVWTSAPQPPGALLAFVLVEQVQSLLPVSFSFAAGAMLALVAVELWPQAFTRAGWRGATVGVLGGAAVMFALSAALGV
jgi:ZIP family zinc transporter